MGNEIKDQQKIIHDLEDRVIELRTEKEVLTAKKMLEYRDNSFVSSASP